MPEPRGNCSARAQRLHDTFHVCEEREERHFTWVQVVLGQRGCCSDGHLGTPSWLGMSGRDLMEAAPWGLCPGWADTHPDAHTWLCLVTQTDTTVWAFVVSSSPSISSIALKVLDPGWPD